jgi:hypothetical protein
LRLPAHGNVPAWEFERGKRELRVRVEGQLTFNGTAQLLNGALAGCGLAYIPEGLVRGPTMPFADHVSPVGSFTDPEYAQVGLTEKKARETHDAVTAVAHFDSTTRTSRRSQDQPSTGRAQCLDRRIPDKQTLIDEIDAWQHNRNTHHTKSDWHFTTKDARVKLKHLHPSI